MFNTLEDEARARAAHRNRSFATGTNALGEGWGRFNGPAHLVARLNAQLKPFLDQVFAQARREGRRERPDAYAFDAFMAFAGLLDLEAPAEDGSHEGAGQAVPAPTESTLPGEDGAPGDRGPARRGDDHPPGGNAGAPPPTPPPPTAPARRPTVRPDTRVILRVDATALRRGHTVAGETCDVAGLGPLSVADLKALLPDAAIDIVITNGQDVFNVTHLSRRANARQQVVLDLLNIGCTREGCNATQHLHVDHRVDWHKIHVTELANLDWLCPHDHDLKTHHGWRLEPGTGKRPMQPPGRQPWLETAGGGDPSQAA